MTDFISRRRSRFALLALLALAPIAWAQTAAEFITSGEAKHRRGDINGAIADYDRALELDPKSAQAHNNRGAARQAKGEIDSAMADYNKAIELDPKLANAFNNRAGARMEKKDLNGAIADYDRAIALEVTHAPAYSNRAFAKVQRGDLDAALADYDLALKYNPKYTGAFVNRGNTRQSKGDHQGAIADFTSALQLDEKNLPATTNRGMAHYVLRQWEPALADFKRACDLDARNQEYPRFYIWLIESHQGNKDAARKSLADYVAASRPGAWQTKIALFLLDSTKEEDFLASAMDNGQKCEAWFFAGMKRLFSGDKVMAADYFKKSIATGEKNSVDYLFAESELKTLAN